MERYVESKMNVKVINLGSVYLYNLKRKKNKNSIDKDNITILYSSSPFRFFMANLEEITPEQNLIHKNKVLGFIKKLLKNYSNLKIIHKPFTQMEQSLTKNIFAKEKKDNRFIIVK